MHSTCAAHLTLPFSIRFSPFRSRNVTVRRLRRQQMLGACLLMISACLLLVTAFRLLPLRGGEWKVVLAIAAVLELYTAFRLPAELEKEEKDI